MTWREQDVLEALRRPVPHGNVFEEPASVREIAAMLVVTEVQSCNILCSRYRRTRPEAG